MKAIYAFKVKDAKGQEISLSDYKGKALLVVNTATKCGLAPQYAGLQKLYEKYQGKGFEVLEFPCNQFANQEPHSNEEITKICMGRWGITFKQFDKVDVNGPKTIPLYVWLKDQKPGVGGKNIKWNFTKFLIDKQGKVFKRYSPTTTPEAIENDIIKLL